MDKRALDRILTNMLQSHKGVSDLNFTVGKAPQVEASGELIPVTFDPPISKLTAYQTETLALMLINGDWRLTDTFLKEGSCIFPIPWRD